MEATVVVTRYREPDDMFIRCLQSLAAQTSAQLVVLVLDQKRSEDIRRQCTSLSSSTVALNYRAIKAVSLSYARNYGTRHAKTDLVLFCDTDCVLPANWAATIIRVFNKRKATIVGTKITPVWSVKPHWYQQSKLVLEFYSMLDLGNTEQSVDKVIGASFAIDKKKLGDEAYFRMDLGRVNGVLLGGEETELCARALRKGGRIFYTPRTHADHWVEPQRIKLRWLVKRAYFGGTSRAIRGGKPSSNNAASKKSLLDYCAIALILPPYIFGYLLHKRRHSL